jgi:hypothetical protein
MTQQEFEYAPRFDWEREITRSRRRIAVRVAARASLWVLWTVGLWAAIIVGIVLYPLPSLLP